MLRILAQSESRSGGGGRSKTSGCSTSNANRAWSLERAYLRRHEESTQRFYAARELVLYLYNRLGGHGMHNDHFRHSDHEFHTSALSIAVTVDISPRTHNMAKQGKRECA